MTFILPTILNSLIYSTLPGLGGGIVLFMYGVSQKHYKNNKYIAKLFIELVGASFTATFLTIMLGNSLLQALVSFCIGLSWVKVIQTLRSKVTRFIELILGD